MSAAADAVRFLWGFIRHPREVGSVTPSSRFLARAVARHVPADARAAAELGPGTGPMTRQILKRLGPDAKVLAFEIDPAFCALLRRELGSDPRLQVVEAPAQELPARAAAAGITG